MLTNARLCTYQWLSAAGGPSNIKEGQIVCIEGKSWIAWQMPGLKWDAPETVAASLGLQSLSHFLLPPVRGDGVVWQISGRLADSDASPIDATLTGQAVDMDDALRAIDSAEFGPHDWGGLSWYSDTEEDRSAYVANLAGEGIRMWRDVDADATETWYWELEHRAALPLICFLARQEQLPRLGGSAPSREGALQAAIQAPTHLRVLALQLLGRPFESFHSSNTELFARVREMLLNSARDGTQERLGGLAH